MKNVIMILLFFSLTTCFSQSEKVAYKRILNTNTEMKVTSISYSVNTIEELEKIDWKEVKSIFDTNKDDEIIKLSFGINLKESEKKKVKISGKFSIEGESKNIDNLIKRSKKGINGLVKIYNKYKKN